MQTNEQNAMAGFEAIITLEDLGGYLQKLREKRHVTQESLSTKTGAITGRKITRSRISEIENAKRDRVAERELRVYMRGLKCTPRHIDQVVKVLTRCTATPARECPASPAPPDTYSAGLGGAGDDLTPLKEKSDDDPAAAGHEGEGRERWRQVNTCITPVTTFPPQPSRRRWKGRHFAFAAAALVFAALVGLGIEFSLRRESGNRPTFPGSPAAILVQPSAPPIPEHAPDISKKDMTFPDDAPARVNQQQFTRTRESRNSLAGRGHATGRDATQQLMEAVPVAPCGDELAGQRWSGKAPQCRGSNIVGPVTPDVRGPGSAIGRSRRTGTGTPGLGHSLG